MITLVQSKALGQVTIQTAATLILDSPVTVGNDIVLHFASNDINQSEPGINLGGVAFTTLGARVSINGALIVSFLGHVNIGGGSSIVVTCSENNECILAAEEWSGLATSPADKHAANDDNTWGSNDPCDSGTTAVTSQASEVVIAAWAVCPDDFYQGRSYPNQIFQEVVSPNGLVSLYAGYRIVSSTGAQNEEIDSPVNGGSAYAAVIDTFKITTTPPPSGAAATFFGSD